MSLKNARIIFRVTEEEKKRFIDKVTKSNKTASQLLRERVLEDKMIIVSAQPKASKDKKKLLFFYNKASNNLNQLAHRANSLNLTGELTQPQFDKILAELLVIRSLLKTGIDDVD